MQLVGWQSKAAFEGLLARADIHLNLRDPSYEGASAATVQHLSHGATIVYDAASYAELPGDAVVRGTSCGG